MIFTILLFFNFNYKENWYGTVSDKNKNAFSRALENVWREAEEKALKQQQEMQRQKRLRNQRVTARRR